MSKYQGFDPIDPKLAETLGESRATSRDAGWLNPEQAASLRRKLEKTERALEEVQTLEVIIAMRTRFTGNSPYVGWAGLALALNERLDELEAKAK